MDVVKKLLLNKSVKTGLYYATLFNYGDAQLLEMTAANNGRLTRLTNAPTEADLKAHIDEFVEIIMRHRQAWKACRDKILQLCETDIINSDAVCLFGTSNVEAFEVGIRPTMCASVSQVLKKLQQIPNIHRIRMIE